MPKKVLRDIQKKGSSFSSFYVRIEEKKMQQAGNVNKNLLNLSQVPKKKAVITLDESTKIKDIRPKKVETVHPAVAQAQSTTMFLQVDPNRPSPRQRTGELIRLAAAGMFILFLINLVNIYQRGTRIKNNVIAAAFSGYSNLVEGGNNAKDTHFGDAENNFSAAQKDFEKALEEISFLVSNESIFFTKERTVESAEGLLQAGKNLSEAGADFSRGVENLQNLPVLFLQENGQLSANQMAQDQPMPVAAKLTDKLKKDIEFLSSATAKVLAAKQSLDQVDPSVLPPLLKEKFSSLKEKVETLLTLLQKTEKSIPVFLKLLGDRYPHRYLVLLQNDAESRPTGGFIGSYMIVDLNDGVITKTEFHDVYETDGQLKEDIPAPEDIAKITKTWRMRDSNYSPDYAISAEKAAWFLQKEKGPSVDSVIALNQHFLAELFDITGPVSVAGLQAPLTKENYQMVLSYIIESKLSSISDPKKILRDFIPEFQRNLLKGEHWKKVLLGLIKGLSEQNILIYSRHEDVQNFFDELGYSGRVIRTKPNEDYLNIITTSIGGNKSDAYVSQQVRHFTTIGQDGDMTDEVMITRKHNWGTENLEFVKTTLKSFGFEEVNDTVKYILGAGKNKTIIKVYVPQGSVFIDASGLEKTAVLTREDNEIGKTYFMFEMDIEPGKELEVGLKYKLPVNLQMLPADSYKFFAQKQPGMVISQLEKKIILHPGLTLFEKFPQNLQKDQDGNIMLDQNLEGPVYMAVLVGK